MSCASVKSTVSRFLRVPGSSHCIEYRQKWANHAPKYNFRYDSILGFKLSNTLYSEVKMVFFGILSLSNDAVTMHAGGFVKR